MALVSSIIGKLISSVTESEQEKVNIAKMIIRNAIIFFICIFLYISIYLY